MKIAIFTETYLYDINGVVSHVKTLRDGLLKLGHEVLVVTADKHSRHHYIDNGVLHCPAIEMKNLYGFGAASPHSFKRLRLVEEFDPDVIHIHHEFGIGLSGIMAAKLQRKPLVYTLHTLYDQYVYYIAPKIFHRAATKATHQYAKMIASSATALTGPSAKCTAYFKQIGVKNKDVNVIPNSADLELFNFEKFTEADKKKLRTKLGLKQTDLLAIFAGRTAKEKSIDVLLKYFARAIKKTDKIHLLIIGDGPARE